MSQMHLFMERSVHSQQVRNWGRHGGNHSPKSEAVGKNERIEGTKGGEEICVNFK